ncbi:MAG: hypothetical protein LBP28_00590 [Coriobacteriales bacterium]|jgi:uncharacterized protein YrrD|nr:hypothetical protein [Coriobacteriales bacterium]
MRDTAEFKGVRVLGGRHGTTKIGKIGRAVFHPQTYDLVGYLVKRPDIALIKARTDRFLARDSFRIINGQVVGFADRDAWDQAACKRLGLDFDSCVLLEGMPIAVQGLTGAVDATGSARDADASRDIVATSEPCASVAPRDAAADSAPAASSTTTPAPESLGLIVSVTYDELSGAIESIRVSDGVAAKTLLGTRDIPRELLLGYRDGAVWVKPDAAAVAHSGGLAAKAGAGAAVAGDKVARMAAKAGSKVEQAATDTAIKAGRKLRQGSDKNRQRQEATSDRAAAAIDKGTRAIGRQLGASKGMFKAFRDEYRKAAAGKPAPSGKPADDKPSAKTAPTAKPKKPASQERRIDNA